MRRWLLVLGAVSLMMGIGMVAVAYAQAPTMPGYVQGQSIYDSYHNLGVNGPNNALKSDTVAAGGTTEVCVFCHQAHNATKSRILWNKADWATWPNQTADFGTKGGVPTTDAGTPWDNVTLTRFTLRCLICHDGTTSVGQVAFYYSKTGGAQANASIPMTGSDQSGGKITNPLFLIGNVITAGKRDLGGNHPVSMPYAGSTYNGIVSGCGQDNTGGTGTCGNFVAPALVLSSVDPEALQGVAGAYGIECGSCHDTHAQADATKSSTLPSHLGQMIRAGMDSSNLCFGCHIR